MRNKTQREEGGGRNVEFSLEREAEEGEAEGIAVAGGAAGSRSRKGREGGTLFGHWAG